MKTNVTLSVDQDIKLRMQHLAKHFGTNLSSIVNMYFAHVLHTWKLEFQADMEILFPNSNITKEDIPELIEKMQEVELPESFINNFQKAHA